MSQINILYFASFRESLNSEKETIKLTGALNTVADLKQLLSQRDAPWNDVFSSDNSVLVSINQNMAKNNTPINSGDEVAFFPPVTGG